MNRKPQRISILIPNKFYFGSMKIDKSRTKFSTVEFEMLDLIKIYPPFNNYLSTLWTNYLFEPVHATKWNSAINAR